MLAQLMRALLLCGTLSSLSACYWCSVLLSVRSAFISAGQGKGCTAT